MERQKNRKNFEALLVIGLILIIPLFFVMRTAAEQTPAPIAPTAALPTAVNIPAQPTVENAPDDSSNAPAPKQPPACTFPLTEINTPESTPEEYIFSEPQVVLTAPKGNIYNIAEWLPDNQQVLMTEELNNVEIENNKPFPESISLFNPETGETKIYAIRTTTGAPPSWLPDLNAVMYPTINYTSLDRKNGTSKFTRQLWVSYGDPDSAQILADNLPQFPIAIKSGGSETLYFSDKQISKLNKSLKKLLSASFDFTQWDYSKERRNKTPLSYKMAWQPGTSLIFLYSDGAVGGGGYTFILDADTGHMCELDFGGWAKGAHWSSDGHYLAFIKSTRYAFPTYSADLTVLDTVTGNLNTLSVITQETEGLHFVDDFVWAPDNRHLLAIGEIYTSPDIQSETGLYLVDFISGQSIRVVPEKKGFVFSNNNNVAWSPDGSKVAIHCPTETVDQICLVSVQRTAQ
jgi:Tol biopolymer transport system component